MRVRLFGAAAIAGLLSAAPVMTHAQSSQDYLRALQPPTTVGGASRGIRPTAPGDAAPASPSSAPSARPASGAPPHTRNAAIVRPAPAEPATGEVNIFIEFRSGSAQLTPSAMHALNNLGGALINARLASYRFRIEGHTDTVGSPEINKALSEQRAAAVVAYLTEKFHIDASKLDAVGLGETDLLVPTPPQTPEARNRRVRVVNLGA